MTAAAYWIASGSLIPACLIAAAGVYLKKRAGRELDFAPPALLQSFVGALACEIGFFFGAILLAIFGVSTGDGEGIVRRPALLLAMMAGVCYLELGAPIGAIVRGHPFSSIQKPGGGFGVVTYWLQKASRHGYRMGVFFASLLPVLAGARLQIPGLPSWIGSVLGFFWIATVVWTLRGKSLFSAQQPLVGALAALLSLYGASQANDSFLQALSFLVLVISGFAMLLNLPQLLPLRTWASGAYFLALLTVLNSSHHTAVVFLLLTTAAAVAAKKSRKRPTHRPPTSAPPAAIRRGTNWRSEAIVDSQTPR